MGWFLEIEIEIEQPERLIYQLGALLLWASAPGCLKQLGRAREQRQRPRTSSFPVSSILHDAT